MIITEPIGNSAISFELIDYCLAAKCFVEVGEISVGDNSIHRIDPINQAMTPMRKIAATMTAKTSSPR
jgi:hypothetical protein